jgi:tryptophan aminotransferase
MFPFTSFQFGTHDPVDRSKEYSLSVDPTLLSQGLQYAATDGLPDCVEWLTGLQEHEHHRNRNEGWRVSVTAGSQDAIYKVGSLQFCLLKR